MKRKSSKRYNDEDEYQLPGQKAQQVRDIAKRARVSQLAPIFQSLIDANKLDENPLYEQLLAYPGKIPPTNLDLGKFIGRQLATDPNFNKVNLDITAKQAKKGDIGRYDPQTKQFSLYPGSTQSGDPFRTFIHEGTHALDYSDRSDLNTAIPYLAKTENKIMSDEDPNPSMLNYPTWYKEAQKLLGSEDFIKGYPFSPYVGSNIAGAFEQIDKNGNERNDLSLPDYYPEEYDPSLERAQNFRELQERLGKNPNPQDTYFRGYNRQTSQHEGNPYVIAPFTEMKAHAVENLGAPWLIDEGNWQEFPQGRKFLKSMTKGAYQDFLNRDPNFSTTYPDANQSFRDRINQLRNYENYPDTYPANKYPAPRILEEKSRSSESSQQSPTPSIRERSQSSQSLEGNQPVLAPRAPSFLDMATRIRAPRLEDGVMPITPSWMRAILEPERAQPETTPPYLEPARRESVLSPRMRTFEDVMRSYKDERDLNTTQSQIITPDVGTKGRSFEEVMRSYRDAKSPSPTPAYNYSFAPFHNTSESSSEEPNPNSQWISNNDSPYMTSTSGVMRGPTIPWPQWNGGK